MIGLSAPCNYSPILRGRVGSRGRGRVRGGAKWAKGRVLGGARWARGRMRGGAKWAKGRDLGGVRELVSSRPEIIGDDHSVASLPTLGLQGNPFKCGTTLFA